MQRDLMDLTLRQEIEEAHVEAESVDVLREIAALAEERHREDGIAPRQHHLGVGTIPLLHPDRVLGAGEVVARRIPPRNSGGVPEPVGPIPLGSAQK